MRSNRSIITCIVIALIAQIALAARTPAYGQDSSVDGLLRIMEETNRLLGGGDPSTLIPVFPGIFLDPKLKLDGTDKKDDAAAFYNVLDQIPAREQTFTPSSFRYLDVYEWMLTHRQLPDLSIKDPKDKKALEAAYKKVYVGGDPEKGRTERYKDFVAAENAFWTAVRAERRATTQEDTEDKRDLRVQAENIFKYDYADIREADSIQTFWSYFSTGGWWIDRLNGVRRGTSTTEAGLRFGSVLLSPSYATIVARNVPDNKDEKADWTLIKLDEEDLYDKKVEESWDTSVRGRAGWFFVKAGFNRNDKGKRIEIDKATRIVNIEFEVTRVTMFRPWMDPLVFWHRGWRMGKEAALDSRFGIGPDRIAKDFGAGVISDGKGLSGTGDEVLVPVITTGFLVMKNAKLTFQNETQAEDVFNRITTTQGSGRAGWGWFGARGSYSNTTSADANEKRVSKRGATLEIGDPQIIAFLYSIPPKSPNPPPGIFGDDGPEAAEVAARKAASDTATQSGASVTSDDAE